MSEWSPIAYEYDPLKAGSIDGTDTEPHDRAVWRAMNAHYKPSDIQSKPEHTLFVGRLPYHLKEEQLYEKFSQFGIVENIHLIRDIVTGQSRGYGFVVFRHEHDARLAYQECDNLEIEGSPVIIDWEVGHRMKGWIPRRLGGGWGGRKEAGQLRFGCKDRPWRKPIIIHNKHHSRNTSSREGYRDAGSSVNRRYNDSHRPYKAKENKNYQLQLCHEGNQERIKQYDHRRGRSIERNGDDSRQRGYHHGRHSSYCLASARHEDMKRYAVTEK
ncbi:U11/U12 small nuclear ribonucleoprotein 35 kDa protein isoform X1 [Panulirus ornatus]|uniref:U11/U12 small nuclear ribonucleoprotein 35 kDa protein isoform X1 n=1 Tax=Panulirus ornatus TaxID=150431 RepID=UPI003A87EFEE